MSATIDDDAAVYVYADVTDLTSDPTTATIALEIGPGHTQYPMTWTGAAVQSGSTWSRTARTTSRFVGSTRAPVAPDVQLAAGTYEAQPILTTTDGQIVPLAVARLTIN